MRDLICGVDEAGRGPLAGSVYAAAVILGPDHGISGLADSKVMTAANRESVAAEIRLRALAFAVASASVDEIDQVNILKATMLAMQRAVEQLRVVPFHVLIDGNRCPDISINAEAIVKGDTKEPAISAASILAKVTRDRQMQMLHAQYPQFAFNQHKGYPTVAHLKAINQYGICPEHRKTFGPVKNYLHLNLIHD